MPEDQTQDPQEVGPWEVSIAWYRPEQWPRLLEVSIDGDRLHKTYEQWLDFTNDLVADIESNGQSVIKVEVDVEELTAWCKQQGLSLDGDARAEFVTYKLERRQQRNQLCSSAAVSSR